MPLPDFSFRLLIVNKPPSYYTRIKASQHIYPAASSTRYSSTIPGKSASNDKNHNHNQNHNHAHCDTCSCLPTVPPKHSFYKRSLPPSLIALSSPVGKSLLVNSISSRSAESYFPLVEQFLTQSDPAYCGLTTLAMVLNALSIDPEVQWKGIWRWFDEELLIKNSCFLDRKMVKEDGIIMEEFSALGHCHGADIEIKRTSEHSIDSLRTDIINVVQSTQTFLVASFHRGVLNQTGSGHFSPIAAYDRDKDLALVLDVARFKYTPYWVSIHTLHKAMSSLDTATSLPRGWFLVSASQSDSLSLPTRTAQAKKVNNSESVYINKKSIQSNYINCRLRCDKKMTCSSRIC